MLFRLQSAQTADIFDVQTAVYLNVQTTECSLLVQTTECLDVQSAECSLHVQMAEC